METRRETHGRGDNEQKLRQERGKER